LEFFRIRNRLWRGVFRFYFHQVLPRIARFTKACKTGAYEYLPASVDGFTNVDGFKVMLEEAGFIVVEDVALSGGVARLVVARKPGADEL
jgi:demethylmenaquinone methyltransferase/2-methoxy-6-polyprenyl-1,4-benzoquinol methylase